MCLGEIGYNNFGSKIEIIAYRKYNDIDVYFEEYDWIKYNTNYGYFKKGSIKCPYEPRVYGIGYVGEINNIDKVMYDYWHSMLRRCYDKTRIDKDKGRNLAYINSEVCKEWHNLQNFGKWYENNFYQIEGEKMCLDKDILIKGNEIYSPETCIFVPQKINTLFCSSKSSRGFLPIGVTYEKRYDTYVARCNDGNKNTISLGSFNTPNEAFEKYKEYKECLIKSMADEYKLYIPKELYDAMYRYKVEIND